MCVTLCISAAANIHFICYDCKLLATADLSISVFYIVHHENHINNNYHCCSLHKTLVSKTSQSSFEPLNSKINDERVPEPMDGVCFYPLVTG